MAISMATACFRGPAASRISRWPCFSSFSAGPIDLIHSCGAEL